MITAALSLTHSIVDTAASATLLLLTRGAQVPEPCEGPKKVLNIRKTGLRTILICSNFLNPITTPLLLEWEARNFDES